MSKEISITSHKMLMFPFITKPPWNPLVLYPCPHQCVYCYVPEVVNRYRIRRYLSAKGPAIIESELKRRFKDDEIIFVCDMCDLFAEKVPMELILRVLNYIAKFPRTRFLLLTKNPRRLYDLAVQELMPMNCILGCTIESNRNYAHFSHAPLQAERIRFMRMLFEQKRYPLFWSAEPIFDFDLDAFADQIMGVKPWGVAVGFDNHNKFLPEPPLEKTQRLIKRLRFSGIKVFEKTIRESWQIVEERKMEVMAQNGR